MEPVQLVVRATARLYQRISALFILSGAFVGLLFFLLYFLVNSSYFFPLFDGVLNPQFRGGIGFDRVTWGPAPWTLKVLKPKVWRPDGKEVFVAKSLVIEEVNLRSLLKNDLQVSGLVVEDGRVDLTARLSQETLDWRGQPKPLFDIEEAFWPPGPRYDTGEKAGVTVNVSDIALRHFSIRIDMPEASIVQDGISIEGARFEAEPDAQRVRMGVARLSTGEGQLRVRREDDGPPPLEGDTSTYYQWPIADFRLSNYTWRDDVFTVGKLQAVVNGDPVGVDHFRMDLTVAGTPEMAGTVHAEIADLSRQLAQFGLVEIRGPVSLDLSGRGPPDAFAGEFSIHGQQLSVFGETVDRIRVHGIKAGVGPIELDRVELTALTGLLEGRAVFDPDAGHLAAELSLDGLDVTALQRPLPHIVETLAAGRWKGDVNFRARGLMGDTPEYATDGQLSSRANTRRGQGLGKSVDLEWAVAFKKDLFSLYTFVLLSDQLKVTGEGRLDLKGSKSDLKGKIDVRDLSLVTRDLGLDIGGSLEAPWTLRGPLSAPKVAANVEAKQLRYADFPPADFDSQLTYDGGQLIFEPGGTELRIGDGKVVLRGHVDVGDPNTPIDLRVSARKLDVSAFPIGVSAQGQVGADVNFSGPASALSIGGQIMVRRPCLTLPNNGEEICFRRIDVDGEWSGDDIDINCITVGNPRKPMVMATGTLDLSRRTFNARLNVADLPLPLIARATRAPREKAAPLRGTVSLDLTGQGEFLRPTGKGHLKVQDFWFDQYKFGNGRIAIDAEGEVVSLTGKVFDKFLITAGIPTIPKGRLANAELTFETLAVEDFLPQLAALPIATRLGGRVEAKANLFRGEIHGVFAQFDQLEAVYTLENESGGGLTAKPIIVSNVEPVKLSFRHEVLNVENFLLSVTGESDDSSRSSDADRLVPIAGRSLGTPMGLPGGVANAVAGMTLPMLEDATLPMSESRVKINGTVGTDETLDLTATGLVNLELMQPFLNSVFSRMSGSSSFKLQLGGTADSPLPEGTIQLFLGPSQPRSNVVGGEIRMREVATFHVMPKIGPHFRDDGTIMGGVLGLRLVELDEYGTPIEGTPDPIRFLRDELELKVTELSVDFEEFVPHRVALSATFVEQELNVPRVLRATLGTPLGKDVKFEMSHHGPEGKRLTEPLFTLGGDLKVFWGEYIADVNIQPVEGITNTVSGKSQQQSVDVFEANPALRRLKLDLKLLGDGDFHIKNKIADLALALEIKLELNEIYGFLAPKPQTETLDDEVWEAIKIDGSITVLPDSTLNYANQEFEVSHGRVTFDENTFIKALVEAKREYNVGGSASEEVRLTVTYEQQTRATRARPNITFTTDSGLSNLQAASLVVTGRLPSDIAGAAGAGGAAAGLLLDPLMNLIERPLEDTFDFKLNLTPDSSGQLTIGSELYFTQRLKGSFSLVGSNDKSYGLELQLNNGLFLELDSAQTEADVDTTLRFRGTWELD